MNVTISKGPNFQTAEKKVYQYLNKVLTQKAAEKQNERKGA